MFALRAYKRLPQANLDAGRIHSARSFENTGLPNGLAHLGTGAPGFVTQAQLGELSIAITHTEED